MVKNKKRDNQGHLFEIFLLIIVTMLHYPEHLSL
jgi:hypothetical protein